MSDPKDDDSDLRLRTFLERHSWIPWIAAAILVLAPEYLRAFSEYRMLLFGAVMVIMMIYRPQGLISGEKRTYKITNKDKIDSSKSAFDVPATGGQA